MNFKSGSNLKLTAVLSCTVLASIAFWIYYPSLTGLAQWDDGTEIFKNNWILKDTLSWHIWISSSGPDYQPLKTTIEWLLYHLGNAHVTVFHGTSIVLHVASGLLIWKIASRFNLASSWLAGLLFIIHPLSVSTVAWIAELKNTLSLPLLLLAIDQFLTNDLEDQTEKKISVKALIYFILSLLCKSSGVLFPGFILIYYFWKNNRITKQNFKQILLFSTFAVIIGLITLKLQITEAMPGQTNDTKPLALRVLYTIPLLGSYFLHFIWPFKLAPVYENSINLTTWLVGLTYLGTSIYCYLLGNRLLKTIGVFLLVAGIFLLPVLGLLPMSFLLISLVGDHLAYISLAMWCIGSALGINYIAQSFKRHFSTNTVLLTYAIYLGLCLSFIPESRSYANSYQNSLSLWTRAVSTTPNSWFSLNNLGEAELATHQEAMALTTLERAYHINPNKSEVLINLSEAYLQVRDLKNAIFIAKKAIALEPSNASAHYNLANALAANKDLNDAIGEYKEAEKLEPLSSEFHYNHAVALSELGLLNASIYEFNTCIELNPKAKEAYVNLATLHASLGEWNEASLKYRKVLDLDPEFFEANYGYADCLMALGNASQAIVYYNQALRAQPDHPGVLDGLKQAKQALLLKH